MVYDNIEHWEKLYSNHFNLAGSGYTELGEAYNRWLYKLRTKVFNKALIEHNIAFSDNLKVLDIGCGTGFFTNEFQKREIKKLVGYDLTRISIEKLRIRFPQYNFFQQDISAPLKSNDRFNFINIFDVLWYLDDADFEKAFNNLAKLSQKGSFLFITDIFTKDKYNQSEGFWARSIPIYEFYCKRCGFEIVKIYPLFVFTNTPCDPDSVNKWFFRFLSIHWRLVSGMLRKYNFLGNLLGFSLFMFDYIIVQFIKNGPSSKLMVLKKI